MPKFITVATTGDRPLLSCPQCKSTKTRLMATGRWVPPDKDHGGDEYDCGATVRFRCGNGHMFTYTFLSSNDQTSVDCEIKAIRSIYTPDGPERD